MRSMKLNNISTALIFHKNVRLNVVQNVRTPEAEERRGTYILDTANLRQCNVANNFVSNSLFIIISQAAQAYSLCYAIYTYIKTLYGNFWIG